MAIRDTIGTADRSAVTATPLMTVGMLADFMHLKKQTLDAWRSQGEGPPYVKFGRAIRYELAAVKTWIAARTHNTGTLHVTYDLTESKSDPLTLDERRRNQGK